MNEIFDPLNIILAVTAIFATLYIAYRQGAFLSKKIFISPGTYIDNDKLCKVIYKDFNRPLWGLVLRVPQSDFDTMITYIPILIRNCGKTALKNVVISLRYSRDLDSVAWWNKNKILFSSNTREDVIFNSKTKTDDIGNSVHSYISIPSIPPKANMVSFEPIAIARNTFADRALEHNSEGINTYVVECCVVGDSIKETISFNFYLILTQAATLDNLVARSENHILQMQTNDYLKKYSHLFSKALLINKVMIRFPKFQKVTKVTSNDCSENVKELSGYYGEFRGINSPEKDIQFKMFLTKEYNAYTANPL